MCTLVRCRKRAGRMARTTIARRGVLALGLLLLLTASLLVNQAAARDGKFGDWLCQNSAMIPALCVCVCVCVCWAQVGVQYARPGLGATYDTHDKTPKER